MRRLGGACGAVAPVIMRLGLLVLSAMVVADRSAMADGEQVLLPYQCSVDRGRVALSPAPERAYRLVSPRASHAFTACAPANPNRCRTWQIHKFDFMCGGQRVPWLAVAATLIERAPQRGRIENGRLMLRLGPEWQRRALIPTGFRDPFGDAEKMLAFPVGFAPSLGSGVRFAGALTPPPTVVDAKPEPKVSEAKPTEPKGAEARSDGKMAKVESRPTTTVEPPAAKQPTTAISQGWAATVTPAGSLSAEAAGFSVAIRGVVGGCIVLLAWAGLLFARRRFAGSGSTANVQSGSPAPASSGSNTTDEAALCAELVARAVNLHQVSREAVGALPNANLRTILTNDLSAIQRRLLSAELTADVADERWHAVKPMVTAALTDLERIARIIAGVLSSQPAPSPDVAPLVAMAAVPETADEAFEILGVNPAASRTVVKKVVDGLRQSWHPDHARDTQDRVRREERMKQINIAWDLIRSSQEPATGAVEAERAA